MINLQKFKAFIKTSVAHLKWTEFSNCEQSLASYFRSSLAGFLSIDIRGFCVFCVFWRKAAETRKATKLCFLLKVETRPSPNLNRGESGSEGSGLHNFKAPNVPKASLLLA